MTALLLTGPIYILVYNLISLSEFDKLQKLEIIVQNAQVNLANLQVKEVFQLNSNYRSQVVEGSSPDRKVSGQLVLDGSCDQDDDGSLFEPYQMTIEHLKELQWEQSPIAKIDLIY